MLSSLVKSKASLEPTSRPSQPSGWYRGWSRSGITSFLRRSPYSASVKERGKWLICFSSFHVWCLMPCGAWKHRQNAYQILKTHLRPVLIPFKVRQRWFSCEKPYVNNCVDISVTTWHILNYDTSNASWDLKPSDHNKSMLAYTGMSEKSEW